MKREQIIEVLDKVLGDTMTFYESAIKKRIANELLALQEEDRPTVEELKNEGIKYLEKKYPNKKILQLPELAEAGEYCDFVMGYQIGYGIALQGEEINADSNCFHECPNCNSRCNCSDQPCSCCKEQPRLTDECKVYYCTICHTNIVDAENGFDTCSDCLSEM